MHHHSDDQHPGLLNDPERIEPKFDPCISMPKFVKSSYIISIEDWQWSIVFIAG